MRFFVNAVNAGVNNSPAAHLRETTRMMCLAEALHLLGHDVGVRYSQHFRQRAKHFSVPWDKTDKADVVIVPAETARVGTVPANAVGFKCSVTTKYDAMFCSHFRLLMAHEYDTLRSNIVPIPFLVFDGLLRHWMDAGLFQSYLDDDLDTIRSAYPEKEHLALLGFRGCGIRHRKEFCEQAPDWLDVGFYTSPPMTPDEHSHWLMGFRGGLLLPGETPKCNLFAQLVVLGRVIVAPPQTAQVEPPIDASNSVVFQSWEWTKSVLENEYVCKRLVEKADADYTDGWSPLGQARLLVARLECS